MVGVELKVNENRRIFHYPTWCITFHYLKSCITFHYPKLQYTVVEPFIFQNCISNIEDPFIAIQNPHLGVYMRKVWRHVCGSPGPAGTLPPANGGRTSCGGGGVPSLHRELELHEDVVLANVQVDLVERGAFRESCNCKQTNDKYKYFNYWFINFNVNEAILRMAQEYFPTREYD